MASSKILLSGDVSFVMEICDDEPKVWDEVHCK